MLGEILDNHKKLT